MGAHEQATGPDFAFGSPLKDIPEGVTICGRVGEDPVLLSRFGGEIFAIDGSCTHYGALLSAGLFSDGVVRCPLHHACFDLKTGAALRAPALDALDRWEVEVEDDVVFVRRKVLRATDVATRPPAGVQRVVIIGGGAAGQACAEELRTQGYDGSIILLSAECDLPCDRPNLSKDYLAGIAPEEWLPLRPADWYKRKRIEVRLGTEVERIEPESGLVHCNSAEAVAFERLLIATGSEPHRLEGPGFQRDNIFTLRSVSDAKAVVAHAKAGATAVVVGSSFIGMEVAAALSRRDVQVTVISPEQVPFAGTFGHELGAFVRALHERHGVHFHMDTVAAAFDGGIIKLANGVTLPADMIIIGIGGRARVGLAQAIGIPADRGIPVDAYLETCREGIFAAGDVAEYPAPGSGEPLRIEHWVTAQRQGQVAARNMLGSREPFAAIPFFWTEQYGVAIRYVGHASRWDRIAIEGDVASADFIARYFDAEVHRASAAVGRDLELLEDELRFECIQKSQFDGRELCTNVSI